MKNKQASELIFFFLFEVGRNKSAVLLPAASKVQRKKLTDLKKFNKDDIVRPATCLREGNLRQSMASASATCLTVTQGSF